METFSALLAICAGNSSVTGEFPAQRPVTQSFDVFFDLRPNKRLSKQSWGWWHESPSSSLWRHRNVTSCCILMFQLSHQSKSLLVSGHWSPRRFLHITTLWLSLWLNLFSWYTLFFKERHLFCITVILNTWKSRYLIESNNLTSVKKTHLIDNKCQDVRNRY